MSKDEILADWWYDTLWHSAGVLMLVAVVGLFGWRFVEQIRRRERAEAEAILAHEALARLNLTLETLAQQDSLTGLANRRHFDETRAGEFARMARNSHFLGLIMIDVDYFKAYNDRYGHLAGDECLRLLSRTIEGTACKRPGDLACRYGGEEIAVVLPDTKLEGVLSVAQEVHAGIQALALSHADSPFGCVTVSLGVAAIIPKPDSDPNALIQVADEALYRAKSTGRNRVCVADTAVLSATVTPGDSAP